MRETDDTLDRLPSQPKESQNSKFIVFGLFLAIPTILFESFRGGIDISVVPVALSYTVIAYVFLTMILSTVMRFLKRHVEYKDLLGQSFFYVSLVLFVVIFGWWILRPMVP